MKNTTLVSGILILLAAGSLQARQIGDFNGDGSVNLVDVISFINHLSGRGQVEEIGKEYIDNIPDMNDIPDLTLGSDGPNLPIENGEWDEVNTMILEILNTACRELIEKKDDEFRTVIEGEYSGTVSLLGNWSEEEEFIFQKFEVVLEDFSDDGEKFLSGKFDMNIFENGKSFNGEIYVRDIYLLGGLKLSGKYSNDLWYKCSLMKGLSETIYEASGTFIIYKRMGMVTSMISSNFDLTFPGDPKDWEYGPNYHSGVIEWDDSSGVSDQ